MDDALSIAEIMFRDRSSLVTLVAGVLVLAPLAQLLACRAGWSRPRRAAAALAGVGLAGTVALTLGRWFVLSDWEWRGCSAGSSLTALDGEAILNWLVLAPVGFFAMLAWQRLLPVLVACAAVPLLVEALQSFAALGQCQAADVVRNGGGALAAALLGAGVLALGRR
ncbi:MAG: VanZ family protein [Nocardioidaceae bacterium]